MTHARPRAPLQSQSVHGNEVRIVLRGLPARPIVIHTERAPTGTCTSTSSVTISNDTHARLYDIYVKQSLFGVDYVLLTGWASNGAVVREKLTI
jgi:hypothetical protein